MSELSNREQRRSLLAGGIALLLGVGLGRYAFTPLIPPLVEAGWFSAHQTAELGAINLLGYLLGAASADRMARRCGPRRTIGGGLIAITVSLLACAVPGGMLWYGLWRLAAGWAAATLTIVVTPIVMTRVPIARRPAASAAIFTGMGIGTISASLIVPVLATAGISATWAAIAGLAGLLAGWSWWAVWRHLPAGSPAANSAARTAASGPAPRLALALIVIAYGLAAAGYVPQSLYWVDYIARELGRGLVVGNINWLLLGAGGVVGPALAGAVAARLGFRRALLVAFILLTGATALPLISSSLAALAVSSFVVGAMVPAVITLTAGTVVNLSPEDSRRRIWGWATLAFAGAQAIGGFGMSRLYAMAGTYWDTIALGAALLLLGTVCAAIVALARRSS